LSATSSGQPTLVVKTRENSGKILSSYEVKMKKKRRTFCCKMLQNFFVFSVTPINLANS